MWKVCLGQNGFISGKLYGYNISAQQVLDHAVALGYDGIELSRAIEPFPDNDPEAVAALRKKYESRGLKIAGIQTDVGPAHGAHEDHAMRAAYARKTVARLQFVKALGSELLGVWPGPTRPELSDKVIIERLADTFSQCIAAAESIGVILAMEPEPVQIDRNYDIAMGVVEKLGSRRFTVLYDSTHANVLSNGDPVGIIKKCAGHIGHVHLADNDGGCATQPDSSRSSKHMIFGEGKLDIPAILKALKDANYYGWIQVDAWEHPDPLRCSEINKKKLDEMLKEM